LKFIVDMPVTPQAVPHLQDKGHDAVHASAVGGRPDSDTLDRARAEGLIVVTADLDYPRLLALSRQAARA
jgi:predicted nuclease of predicted toxin-antitoxin system